MYSITTYNKFEAYIDQIDLYIFNIGGINPYKEVSFVILGYLFYTSYKYH